MILAGAGYGWAVPPTASNKRNLTASKNEEASSSSEVA
jgi:hypothetical protein